MTLSEITEGWGEYAFCEEDLFKEELDFFDWIRNELPYQYFNSSRCYIEGAHGLSDFKGKWTQCPGQAEHTGCDYDHPTRCHWCFPFWVHQWSNITVHQGVISSNTGNEIVEDPGIDIWDLGYETFTERIETGEGGVLTQLSSLLPLLFVALGEDFRESWEHELEEQYGWERITGPKTLMNQLNRFARWLRLEVSYTWSMETFPKSGRVLKPTHAG